MAQPDLYGPAVASALEIAERLVNHSSPLPKTRKAGKASDPFTDAQISRAQQIGSLAYAMLSALTDPPDSMKARILAMQKPQP